MYSFMVLSEPCQMKIYICCVKFANARKKTEAPNNFMYFICFTSTSVPLWCILTLLKAHFLQQLF